MSAVARSIESDQAQVTPIEGIHYCGNKRAAVVCIPKAGLRSMRHAVGNNLKPAEAAERPARVAFIRNPFDRLVSGFSHFHHMTIRQTRYNGDAVTFADTWSDWVDHILEYRDIHWLPQTEIIGAFANRFHRFENVMSEWEQYFPGFFPHIGKVSRVATYPYRVRDIMSKYREDIELWRSL